MARPEGRANAPTCGPNKEENVHPIRQVLRGALALALAASSGAFLEAQESDNATRRARARQEWYHEAYRAPVRSRDRVRKQGGPWSRQYRRFLMAAAARERAKWGALIPANAAPPSVAEPQARVAAAGTSWVSLGPTKADYLSNGNLTLNATDTGRVRNFVTHPSDPNVLYVAFSGGGVWKTTDGGTSWQALTESLGSLSTGWLAVDPNNANVLHLGLGDPFDGTGIGVVKSSDGGQTWSEPVFVGDSQVTTQIQVAPSDSQIVLAATDRGLFRSTDGGAAMRLSRCPPAAPRCRTRGPSPGRAGPTSSWPRKRTPSRWKTPPTVRSSPARTTA
jgi:hypothetical protein